MLSKKTLFYRNLEKAQINKGFNAWTLMYRREYDKILKRIDELTLNPSMKMKMKDYAWLRRYEIVDVTAENATVKELVKKGTHLRFACAEDLFDVIDAVHLASGHKGVCKSVPTVFKEARKIYANVSAAQIRLYLQLCEECRWKRSDQEEMKSLSLPAVDPTANKGAAEVTNSTIFLLPIYQNPLIVPSGINSEISSVNGYTQQYMANTRPIYSIIPVSVEGKSSEINGSEERKDKCNESSSLKPVGNSNSIESSSLKVFGENNQLCKIKISKTNDLPLHDGEIRKKVPENKDTKPKNSAFHVKCFTCNQNAGQYDCEEHLLFGGVKCSLCNAVFRDCESFHVAAVEYGLGNVLCKHRFIYFKNPIFYLRENFLPGNFGSGKLRNSIRNYISELKSLEKLHPWDQAIKLCKEYVENEGKEDCNEVKNSKHNDTSQSLTLNACEKVCRLKRDRELLEPDSLLQCDSILVKREIKPVKLTDPCSKYSLDERGRYIVRGKSKRGRGRPRKCESLQTSLPKLTDTEGEITTRKRRGRPPKRRCSLEEESVEFVQTPTDGFYIVSVEPIEECPNCYEVFSPLQLSVNVSTFLITGVCRGCGLTVYITKAAPELQILTDNTLEQKPLAIDELKDPVPPENGKKERTPEVQMTDNNLELKAFEIKKVTIPPEKGTKERTPELQVADKSLETKNQNSLVPPEKEKKEKMLELPVSEQNAIETGNNNDLVPLEKNKNKRIRSI